MVGALAPCPKRRTCPRAVPPHQVKLLRNASAKSPLVERVVQIHQLHRVIEPDHGIASGEAATTRNSAGDPTARTTDEKVPVGRRKWLLALVALLALAGGGWVLAQQVQSPSQAASKAGPPEASWITAPVEHRVLAQTVIVRGMVRPQLSISVLPPSSVEGNPVVTAISAAVGDEVLEGTRLLEVSGRPVFLLQGDVPVFRSLNPLMSGPDVTQLQLALTRLGCDTSTDAGVFGEATKLCVAKLYSDAGYVPVPVAPATDVAAAESAVTDSQAAVDAAQQALTTASQGPTQADLRTADAEVRAARRGYEDAVAAGSDAETAAQNAVAQAQAALDQIRTTPEAGPTDIAAAEAELAAALAAVAPAQRAATSAIASADDTLSLAIAARDDLNVQPDVSAESATLWNATVARDRAQATLDQLRASAGPTIAQGEVMFVPILPARVQQIVNALGPLSTQSEPVQDATMPAADLATLTAGDLIVTTTFSPAEHDLVRIGMTVQLLDERTNASYQGTVLSVAEAAVAGPDGVSGFPASVVPVDPLPQSLAGANVRITVTAASTEAPTLVVPLAAVSSAADGSTSVSVVPSDEPTGIEPQSIPVRAGLSADGFVAVESVVPNALRQGDKVVVGR